MTTESIDIVDLIRTADVEGLVGVFNFAADWPTRELAMVGLDTMFREHGARPEVRAQLESWLPQLIELCRAESSGGTYRTNCIDGAESLLGRLVSSRGDGPTVSETSTGQVPVVSVVIFRQGNDQPDSGEDYYRAVVAKSYPGDVAVDKWRIVGIRAALRVSEARTLYRRQVVEAALPHLGFEHHAFEGTGPDGRPIVALYFTLDRATTSAPEDGDHGVIADYWRQLGRTWWTRQPLSRVDAICDDCNEEIPRAEGSMAGSYLICARCCDKRLDGWREHLAMNPAFYGEGVLEKARSLARAGAAPAQTQTPRVASEAASADERADEDADDDADDEMLGAVFAAHVAGAKEGDLVFAEDGVPSFTPYELVHMYSQGVREFVWFEGGRRNRIELTRGMAELAAIEVELQGGRRALGEHAIAQIERARVGRRRLMGVAAVALLVGLVGVVGVVAGRSAPKMAPVATTSAAAATAVPATAAPIEPAAAAPIESVAPPRESLAAPIPKCWLTVEAMPFGTARLDGRELGVTPLREQVDCDGQNHSIEVVRSEHPVWRSTIVLREDTMVRADSPSDATVPPAAAITPARDTTSARARKEKAMPSPTKDPRDPW